MIVAYWIVAGLLALLYLYSGAAKVLLSRERLQPMMNWVDTMPMGLVRGIGALELLGAVGLILPPATGVLPWLAFAAAVGLVLVQIGAIILHVSRGEAKQLGLNIGAIIAAGVAVWLATAWL